MAGQDKTWRGSSRQERDAQRRSRLLDAGLECFGTAGNRGTTVAGLCTLAGVSTRHFYELFPHRDAVLSAVYERICDGLIGRIDAVSPPSGDSAGWLHAAVRDVLDPLLADPRTIRILEIEMVGASPPLERVRLETTGRIVESLAAWYAVVSGDDDPTAGRMVAIFVEGGMSEMLVAHARGGIAGASSAADLIDAVSTLIARLISPADLRP